MSTTLAAALAAALTVPTPAPSEPVRYAPTVALETQARPDSAFTVTAPISDQIELGSLSAIDMEQTNIWLHTHVGGNVHQPYEENPLLGKHPSMTRMLVTGAVMDAVILHLPSPALRRFAIGVELSNVARNFSIGAHL